jgi:hypothetical protein
MRVVVIGGLGNFGARICRRLSSEPGLQVIAASRSTGLDANASDFAVALAALRPGVVIQCAGPFQGQDYRVVAAALACGAHYIDLADGREFVAQFAAQNHAIAQAAGRLAVTGASTLPALSSAVIDHLLPRFSQIDEIDMTIAPGQRAPRGLATMAAVLGYAGRAFLWWRDGSWQKAYGWQELRKVSFPFGVRHAAACDVPDLTLLPPRYPGVRSVSFRAALELRVQQYAMWCIAGVRRIGIPLPIERWVGFFLRAAGWLDRCGTDRGGMSVSVSGRDETGHRRRVTWQIVAKSNHGPEIPCMASVLLTRKLAAGEKLPPGATPCMGLLTLAEFESEFARWDMNTTIVEEGERGVERVPLSG